MALSFSKNSDELTVELVITSEFGLIAYVYSSCLKRAMNVEAC